MTRSTSAQLHELAQAAGVSRRWRDVDGRDREVTDTALAAILAALGHQAETGSQIGRSLAGLAEERGGLPAMLVTETGLPTPVSAASDSAEITDEAGQTRRIAIGRDGLEPIYEPGYYDLSLGSQNIRLAVAPRHCRVAGMEGRRLWGTAVQIPSLRGPLPQAFGDFSDLAAAAGALGQRGCGALAINPVHALFPGVGEDYSPYSPSSRIFLNTAMAEPAMLGLSALPQRPSGPLIDWSSALPQRLADLRCVHAGLDAQQRERIRQASLAEGAGLLRHATFDALDCRFRPEGAKGWHQWPAGYRSPASPAVADFAAGNAGEIDFHLFAQWLAREGLAAAQRSACEAGMAIGLIADLAVGVHPGGSDTWAMPDAMLRGLTIGAPPDPLGPLGQNWSITGFSPQGLRDTGYQPWIAMLRSAMRSAGGLRIDHAFGLARLWVIPDGEDSSQGAYLDYPFLDLVRLATLEAHRAGALLIAEDLGTAPSGFTRAVSDRGMLGMRVLWFERAADQGFIGAHDYPAESAAMTGTHDTPTIAGWWSGRDLDWAARLGRLPEGTDRAKAEAIRDWDRGLLWSTIAGHTPRPAPDDPQPAVAAALEHVGGTPAVLALAPIEDLLGEVEQPNLPGTVTGHPNWRRRLAAPLDELLDSPLVAGHLAALSSSRTP